MKTVLVCGLKGGTGKTLVSTSLAKYISDMGVDTVLVDADIDSPNVSEIFRSNKTFKISPDHIDLYHLPHLDIFSFGYYAKDKSISMSSEAYTQILLDILTYGNFKVDKRKAIYIIDCPAGASNVFQSVIKTFKDSLVGAIVVGIPQNYLDVNRLLKILRYYDVHVLGIVENMAYFKCECGKTYDFGNKKFNEVIKGYKLYGRIPFSPNIKKAIEQGLKDIPDELSKVLDNIYLDILNTKIRKPGFFDKIKDKTYRVVKRNIAKIIIDTIIRVNKEFDIKNLEQHGFGGNVIELVILDEGDILNQVYLKISDGKLKVVKNPKKINITIMVEIDAIIDIIKERMDLETAFYLGKIQVFGLGGSIRAMSFFNTFYEIFSDEIKKVIKSIGV